MPAVFDPYEVLDVPHDATLEQINSKRLRLLKKLHPDVASTEKDLELQAYFNKRTLEINQAWEILSDPVKRVHYDAAHSLPRLVVRDVKAEVEVEPGEDAVIRFTVDNTGGPIPEGKRLTFSPSDKSLKFELLRCESINEETTFPLEVELSFGTSGLSSGVWHETTIEVLLEDA
jgi:curved DNA-binding protein CbpA